MTDTQFPHDRLDAGAVAEQLIVAVDVVVAAIPRGERSIADQLRRATDSVYLNLCEGVGRWQSADKARFYDIAIASCTETGAALRICELRALASGEAIAPPRQLALRQLQLLTALAVSVRARSG